MPFPNDDEIPELSPGGGRRATDSEVPMVLIEWRLTELHRAVREGFARLEARYDAVDKRVASLEGFRERHEENARAAARAEQRTTSMWVPILIATASVITTIVLFLVAQGHG